MRGGGKVFLLGVGHEANSTIHVGEDYAGDYRHKHISPDRPKRIVLNHPENGEVEVVLTDMMGHTVAFDRMDELLKRKGLVTDGRIGEAKCQVMKGMDVIEATVEIIANSKLI